MNIGKLRSLLKCFNCCHVDTRYASANETCKILQKYLGLNEAEIMHYTRIHKLREVDPDQLKALIKLFEKLGYKHSDVIRYPKLLTKTPRIIDNHYLVLKEVGFSYVSMVFIANFRSYMYKKINHLKASSCIPEDLNVPETLITYLYPKPANFDVSDFTDDNLLAQVHSTIVKRYLMWRLEATKDEIETFFRVTGRMNFKSLRHLSENIELALELGFTPRKLLSFGYVIANHPGYPKEVLETMPNLAGGDMRVAMRRYPKLMTVQPWNFPKIYKMLKDAEVNDIMIQKSMNIFTLAPETIKIRLNEVKTVPELQVLTKNPNVLHLIVHHNRARSRLSFLQQLQLKCASLAILGFADSAFTNHIREGRDVNSSREVVNLLSHLLKCEKELIAYSLKKHPYHRQIPLTDIQRTVKYLQDSFRNESIVKVIPIVLYPVEKIDCAFKLSKEDEYLKPFKRLSECKKLNLALYFMEKDHHFSGNGVWNNSNSETS